MSPLVDAHMHVFEGGFQDGSFSSRPGVRLDEAACYTSLAREFRVESALVIGYEAAPWCAGNNAFIAGLSASHPWMNPLAFIADGVVSQESLGEMRNQGFKGISLYITGEESRRGLERIADAVWSLLESWGWLVSVNSRTPYWEAWPSILEKNPELRLLVSHLGLPPQVKHPPGRAEADAAVSAITDLARFPQVHVKLSGLYALSDPGFAYPHRAAWPYIERQLEAFGSRRILWASDFSPCLDWVTFPQTFGVLDEIDFLSQEDRRLIGGGNCLRLLRDIKP